jgi:Ni,Fe-hydrogenase maturation factor
MKRILVAGIGNAWLKDDGFGSEVVKRLEARFSTSAPAGSTSPTR